MASMMGGEKAGSPAPLLLRWTRFAANPFGTGAEKRTAQIQALCTGAGFTLAEMQPPAAVPRWRAWPAGLAARLRWGRRASVDHAGTGLLGYRAVFYRQALRAHRGARVLLWETTYDSLLPERARAAGYRVAALPHNLETFANRGARADLASDLAAEVDRLRMADAVFTIAREESWLLEAHGLAPHYLPYFPDPVLADACARIRDRRRERATTDGHAGGPLLILGSAFNASTARGMRRQLEWLRAAPLPAAGIVVAGFQTETVLADAGFPGVRLAGSVDPATLGDLLASAAALLVHTDGGTGVVTRIVEALLAGVPVVANMNAARDQFGAPGVHIYADAAGFRALTSARLPPPPAPARPVAAEEVFQSALRGWLAGNAAGVPG